jgi:YD repeat-containing protein
VAASQLAWRESYAYDGNGNRIEKTTPWGTIVYTYDAENRLVTKGDIRYTWDKDGNLLSEAGMRRRAAYRYNGANRMVYSEILRHDGRSRVGSVYGYDALGRRTVVQDGGSAAMRTLYDGTGFEVIREGETFSDGRFTTRYSEGAQALTNRGTDGSRYRWIGDDASADARTRVTEEGEYAEGRGRYTGVGVTLYGRGEAVAVSRSGNARTRGGPAYLGKDALGSVRSVTGEDGVLEDLYEYDAFGKPYKGDLENGIWAIRGNPMTRSRGCTTTGTGTTRRRRPALPPLTRCGTGPTGSPMSISTR